MGYSKHQIDRDAPMKSGVQMRPREKQKAHEQPLIGGSRLDLILNMEHELVRLAEAINWVSLVESFGPLYSEKKGHPGIPIRTMAGLVMLQHTFGLLDEQVVGEWPERLYWQFFCGEEIFSVSIWGIRETKGHIQNDLPVDDSQLSRWRKRIGEAGVEQVFKLTIEAGLRTKSITPKQMKVVVVDTTVQPKAVEHPTDARLFRKVLHHLLRVVEATETKLRQSHRDLAKSAFRMHGHYMKAKQFKRAARERKKLKVYAGRMQRDLERKISDEAWEKHKGTLILAGLVLTQEKKTKGKVYSMHAPEVECIAKGKAHKPYDHPTEAERMEDRTESAKPIAARTVRAGGPNQIGVKTSLATTAWGGFVLGAKSLPGNPYDGHTLEEQPEQVVKLTGMMPKRCHVDRDYTIRHRRIGRNDPKEPLPPEGREPRARVMGHGVYPESCQVIIAGSRKGISKAIKKEMKRRSAIEPEVGYQKADDKLGRKWLKGVLGDAQNAVLCAVGHNRRKILAHLRRLFVYIYAWLTVAFKPKLRVQVASGVAA